ncbi:thioesterase II family protein [Micromonospora sp. NPDC051925]|uniref:thioesterase II family protein n=1 Tax=Micromonospora sp. NPDC051925 TaxID=3364288 RepID=UPI0037CA09BF
MWNEVHRLGGTAAPLAGSDELRELLLPRLRADYRLIERYRPDTGLRLPCPIEAWYGDQDPEVSPDDALAWGDATSAGFHHVVFSGHHFYLRDRCAQVAARLAAVARGRVNT